MVLQFSGEDYLARPTSTSVTIYSSVNCSIDWIMIHPYRGLPAPVNDIKIVHENMVVPPYTVGEVWLYVSSLAYSLYMTLIRYHQTRLQCDVGLLGRARCA